MKEMRHFLMNSILLGLREQSITRRPLGAECKGDKEMNVRMTVGVNKERLSNERVDFLYYESLNSRSTSFYHNVGTVDFFNVYLTALCHKQKFSVKVDVRFLP